MLELPTKSVSISEYWFERLARWKKVLGRSKEKIVEAALEYYAPRIDRESDLWQDKEAELKNE